MNIKIFLDNIELPYQRFTFPAGEVGVKITNFYRRKNYNVPKLQTPYKFWAKIRSSDDLMALALLKNAIHEEVGWDQSCHLYLTYLPYGRQDRVCNTGESFSLKVLANFINSLSFDKVFLFDPHSDVAAPLFNRATVFSQLEIIHKFSEFSARCLGPGKYLIAPDAGANKKTAAIAKYFSHSEFVRADKLRDLSNGNILETIVYKDDFKGADVICCDDLCDGGRTFTELARVCKSKGCGKFVLYVTHGVFSKGLVPLLEGGVDEIYCTDSFREDFTYSNGLYVMNLRERFNND